MGEEWLLANDAKAPTYNHTRGDSAEMPCALCRALGRVAELEADLKTFCVLVGNANRRGGFDKSTEHSLKVMRNRAIRLFPDMKWDQ